MIRWDALPQAALIAVGVVVVFTVYGKICASLYKKEKYGAMVLCTFALFLLYILSMWAFGGSPGDTRAPI